ncbi:MULTISPECIES: YqcC family protein [unclassified Vibrio]|uniref:YqcC family protein n=1 Tax=unclassified Vibrio TaxID=2614977 RepID=UPI0009ED5D6D|nr:MULTISPECIES: YqcC family protein [unclassified Vibrio]
MNTDPKQIQKLLLLTQRALYRANLWEENSPSIDALNSTQPFAIDTLRPEQWLQWIFIPKMNGLISANQSLPSGFAIAPYFEQACADNMLWDEVIEVLRKIDEVCR